MPVDELPMDTILDRDPPGGASPALLSVMKTVYLRFAPLAEVRQQENWTATELIDVAEKLRRDGMIRIRWNGKTDDDFEVSLELTPAGSVEAWIRGAGKIGD